MTAAEGLSANWADPDAVTFNLCLRVSLMEGAADVIGVNLKYSCSLPVRCKTSLK